MREVYLGIALVALLGVAPLQFTASYAVLDVPTLSAAKTEIDNLKTEIDTMIVPPGPPPLPPGFTMGEAMALKAQLNAVKLQLDLAISWVGVDEDKMNQRVRTAFNILGAFTNTVNAKFISGSIDATQADSLINDPSSNPDVSDIIVILEGDPIVTTFNSGELSGTVQLTAGQKGKPIVVKNALVPADPKADENKLVAIDFTTDPNKVGTGNFDLEIKVNKQVQGAPEPAGQVFFSFDVNPTIDLSAGDSFTDLPVAVFEVEKDFPSADVQLLFFDGSQWITLGPPTVLLEKNSTFVMQGALPHFSKYAVTGGGGVGGGGGSGGGPAYMLVDTTPPEIVGAFATSNYLCVETYDDIETVSLTYNGREIPRWQGSGAYFCSDENLPPIMKLIAEDAAGNRSEKITINPDEIFALGTEQIFTAMVSKELNPHHDIEGIVLDSKQPLKQIRIAKSPDFNNRELYISEKGLRELYGKQIVEVVYKGQYSDTLSGEERYGQIYVFGTNKGRLATFDVVVKDDIRLYPSQDGHRYVPHELELLTTTALDEMNLNTWQRAELDTVFAGSEELTMTQQNILSKVLRLAYGL